MNKDIMEKIKLEGKEAADPAAIASFFNWFELQEQPLTESIRNVLRHSKSKASEKSWKEAVSGIINYRIKNKRGPMLIIAKSIEGFRIWAYKRAKENSDLLQSIDKYIDDLYKWMKLAQERNNQPDFTELQRLKVQKASLVDNLTRQTSGEAGDEIKTASETERSFTRWHRIKAGFNGLIKSAFQIFTRSFWDSLLHGPK